MSENIYSSSVYLFYILKGLGLASFSYDPKTFKFQLKPVNIFLFLVQLIVWILLTWMETQSKHAQGYTSGIQSNLVERVWQFQYLFQHYIAVFIIVYSLAKRNHIEKFLSQVFTFDQHLKCLNWRTQIKQQNKYYPLSVFVIATGSVSTLMIVLVAKDDQNNYEDLVSYIRIFSYIMIDGFFLMISLQFILSVRCINDRLAAIYDNTR